MRSPADQERGLSRWAIHTGVWVLVGVLLLTIALVFSAREERQGFPSVTNTRPSGLAAFAELLRRDGYRVSLERGPHPEFARDDVVIAVTRPVPEYDLGSPFDQGRTSAHAVQIENHLRGGGRVIEVIHWAQFERASDEAESTRTVYAANDPERKFVVNQINNPFETTTFAIEEMPYSAWLIGDYSVVDYASVGDGLLVTVGEGLPITNRFIDREQNAAFFLDIVRNVASPGSRIVFDESAIGNFEAPTVANTLGPWAVAARWQAILLFAVLVFTLSRRFGLPETEKRRVRSSRELFDAVADVFRRTSNTGLALDNLLIECDQRLRAVLNAPSTMKRSEVLKLAPAEVRDQYLVVSEHANANSPPRRAVEHAARLLRLVEEFERDSRESRGLRRP